jgi:peptidylprolyl isomerase
MPQTVNGQDTSEKQPMKDNRSSTSSRTRPGQRQQVRIQRLARRRKRQRIIGVSLAAVLLIALGITFSVFYQNYNAQQATLHAQATGTADAHVHATSTVRAHATATMIARDCFITPNAPAVPDIYSSSTKPAAGPQTAPAISGTPVTLSGGLKYVDIKVGTGPAVKSGQTVTANYTGWLASTCQKFESSYDAHSGSAIAPISIQLTTGSVIPGWVEGLVGMKDGGIRRLYIPSSLGYGSQAAGSIPANSDLIFDVQLVSFK